MRPRYFVPAVLLLAACPGLDGTSDGSPPIIAITAPADGATVGATLAIDATVVDDYGVDKVSFSVAGILLADQFTPPFHAIWNTRNLPNGTPVPNGTKIFIKVQATDINGNVGSRQVEVTVQNGAN